MMRKRNMRFLMTTLGAALLALAWGSPSRATTFTETFTGSTGSLSASAIFSYDSTGGGSLTVTLENTSPTRPAQNGSLLGAVLFNINNNPTLIPGQANLGTDGSLINTDGTAYTGSYNAADGFFEMRATGGITNGTTNTGYNYIISAVGYGVGNPATTNFTNSTVNPPNIDGGNFSMVPTAGLGYTPNNNYKPLVKGAMVFNFTGVGTTLTAADITQVAFQYGTDLTTDTRLPGGGPPAPPSSVPEPSTLAIAGLGALGLIGYGLRRRRVR
jgi:hypothetical protein